jgi:Protein of unknown function (DUF2510)/Matrixin
MAQTVDRNYLAIAALRRIPEMPGRRGGDEPETPSAPGWYPDPWSATGDGERYFDGKRWGTNERPLGRHTTATIEPTRARTRRRSPSSWDRRTVVTVVVLVGLVGVVWALERSHSSSHSDAAIVRQASDPSTTIPTDRPPRSSEEASKPLGVPAPVPAGPGKYEVLLDQWDNAQVPVAFDPCRPIHYVVNLKGAPADGLSLVESALTRVHTATGLRFIADGATTETPNKQRPSYQPGRYGKRWAPVLIAWSRESAYPDLAGYIAGIGDPESAYTTTGDHLVYVTGQLVLDSRQLSVAALPDRSEVRAIILHELGHLVGLGHTTDRTELMFSESQFNVRDYGPGDLRGLARLGTQACYPDT